MVEHLLPRFGIRYGNAARTGPGCSVKAEIRTAESCSIDVPYCRLSPTGNAYRRIAPCLCQSIPRPRRSITTQRTCARFRSAPASEANQRYPDASGRKNNLRGLDQLNSSMHAHPLRTPKTKRPRGLRPEGVRVASGDRGGRSPREFSRESGVQVPVAFGAQTAAGKLRTRVRAVAWPQGKQDRGDEVRFHGSGFDTGKNRPQGRRPRTIRRLFCLRNCFLTATLRSRPAVVLHRQTRDGLRIGGHR